ncbi:MAG: DNA polymerase subunit beta [Candidatus Competibacteraceae bacterium]|nr:MAG: DNA polymerase subunit beta [Candidatus Competibacteraceae bacterium]
MQRAQALSLLRVHLPEIQTRYGVTALALFGSTARDESRSDSDVDILVDFEEPPSFDRYMALKFFLEDLLGIRVDLGTWRNLKPRIQRRVAQEAIGMAQDRGIARCTGSWLF